ncbi:bis-aminopropyl spermidine synthase family protein [Coprothermobacteraceae bacterium]|nr:bis-aminopropyl spermidine synthase family protein [Coprothermobacteraceae bacterium]
MTRIRRNILRALLAGEKSYWQLIRYQDGSLPDLETELRNLLSEGLIEAHGQMFRLSAEGEKAAVSSGLSAYVPPICSSCKGKTIELDGVYADWARKFVEVTQDRPKAIKDYDQGYVTSEDTVRRVALIHRFGDLEAKDMLIVGDDDLTSLALGITGLPRSVKVLEVDTRLVEYINAKAKQLGMHNVSAELYDVQYPFRQELKGAFDVFITDPVETIEGITLFFSRCAEGLRGVDSVGYFGLTHLESSRQKWYQIQKNLLDMGFVITDIIRDFHEYDLDPEDLLTQGFRVVTKAPVSVQMPDEYFYTSDYFRIYAVRELTPLITGQVTLSDALYYDEEAYVTADR